MNLLTRVLLLVTIALLPPLGVQVFNFTEAQHLRGQVGRQEVLRLAHLAAADQQQAVEATRTLLTSLAEATSLLGRDQGQCDAFFTALRRAEPRYVALGSFDPSGRKLCSDAGTALPAGAAGIVATALSRNGLTAQGYFGPLLPKGLYLAEPVRHGDGAPAAVVLAGLSLDWLNSQISHYRLSPSATVSVVDSSGTILARYPDAAKFVGQKVPAGSHSYMLAGGEGVNSATGFDGIPRIYAFTPVPGSELVVSVGIESSAFLHADASANQRGIIVIAGSAIIALILALAGFRLFVHRPLGALLNAAEHWRRGDLSVRVPQAGQGTEFARLGRAFNAMADAVAFREEELERRIAQRTRALETAMAERQTAETRLQHAQKMETIGRLTGGVAHDFNNLLAAMIGHVELALARIGPAHGAAPRLRSALRIAERGARLTRHLLAFARRQHLRPQTIDLNEYLIGIEDVLQRLLKSDVVIETRLSPQLWPIRVDPDQLEASILNLAVNARDAMPKGGTLRLETKNVGSADDVPAGEFVALVVTDTGTGIAPENIEKVFEPFFTTKQAGHGSGLGLSMVDGFVRQSGGTVRLRSAPGAGTELTLYFPRATSAAEPVQPVDLGSIEPGQGTILLVDDDKDVGQITAEALEQLGYAVILAHDAAEALRVVADRGTEIDVLVTDLVMPGAMNGIDLAHAVAAQCPDLATIFITGHSDALNTITSDGASAVLLKPFRQASLAAAVRDALARKQRAAPPGAAVPVADAPAGD